MVGGSQLDLAVSSAPPLLRSSAPLGLAALALGAALLVGPRLAQLNAVVGRHAAPAGDVVVAEWLAASTPPDAVIMTRLPWQITWHANRRTVMIPLASREEIFGMMRRYGVDYLVLDHVAEARTRRGELQPLYEGREAFGLTKVYELGRFAIVYRVPAELGGGP